MVKSALSYLPVTAKGKYSDFLNGISEKEIEFRL